MENDNITTFVFAKNLDNPNVFFQGYCFVGNDYIYGQDGALKYYSENYKEIPAGEDGCYISVENEGAGYKFKNDYHGYKKIFYYWSEKEWAVSNSISLIVKYLRNRGVSVKPNYSQLAAMSANGMLMQQLMTYDTIVRNIHFLPSGCTLKIGDKLSPVIEKNENKVNDLSYEQSLSLYINVWVSRMETLLISNKVKVSADLTGGVDSRVILAMLLAAKKRLNGENIYFPRLGCGSIAGDLKDLEIAKLICNAFSLELNGPTYKNSNILSSEESLASWRDLCLGIYHPIYLPKKAANPLMIHFGGGGGGNHRQVYDKNNLFSTKEDAIEYYSQSISPKWLSLEFEQSLYETFKYIELTTGSDNVQSLLIEHYRSFRNRLHAGRSPQYSVTFSPLGSSYLDVASSTLGVHQKKSAQVNYDVIASLKYELLNLPFDKDNKKPTKNTLECLTIVDIDSLPNPGKIYAHEGVVASDNKKKVDRFDKLNDEFRHAADTKFSKEFWSNEFISTASATMKKAKENKKFRHAIDGQPISCIIASSLFFD